LFNPSKKRGWSLWQRNIAAALVVANQNFTDPDVLITLIVISIVGLFILMPIRGELGKRSASQRI
jgi:BASS family bile acid:Na+ symporter